jgi:polyhydroxyalkanoate synthesis regulator protein
MPLSDFCHDFGLLKCGTIFSQMCNLSSGQVQVSLVSYLEYNRQTFAKRSENVRKTLEEEIFRSPGESAVV